MKCFGIGTLTHDPVLQDLEINGKIVKLCKLSLLIDEKRATNPSIIDEDTYSFTIWDSAAEYIVNNAQKGDLIYFEASPKKYKYQDESESKPRINISFRINSFRLL